MPNYSSFNKQRFMKWITGQVSPGSMFITYEDERTFSYLDWIKTFLSSPNWLFSGSSFWPDDFNTVEFKRKILLHCLNKHPDRIRYMLEQYNDGPAYDFCREFVPEIFVLLV